MKSPRTLNKRDIQFQGSAIMAIQEAAEYSIIGLFEDTNLCAIHAECDSYAKDVKLAQCIKGEQT